MESKLADLKAKVVEFLSEEDDKFALKNAKYWDGWSTQLDSMIDKLDALSSEFKQKLQDPHLDYQYQEYQWSDIVAGIEQATEDPTVGLRWTDLPPELAVMCVDDMEARTRLNLRLTSRTESELVTSRKLRVPIVSILVGQHLVVTINPTYTTRSQFSSENMPLEDVLQRLLSLLKSVPMIEHFSYYQQQPMIDVPLMPILEQCSSFHISVLHFYLRKNDAQVPLHILNNCSSEVKLVALDNFTDENVYEQFLSCPKFIDSNCAIAFPPNLIDSPMQTEIMTYFIRKWIEMDAPIGKRADFGGIRLPQHLVVQNFQNRFLHPPQEEPDTAGAGIHDGGRIRMDNAEKHIVLEYVIPRAGTPNTTFRVASAL